MKTATRSSAIPSPSDPAALPASRIDTSVRPASIATPPRAANPRRRGRLKHPTVSSPNRRFFLMPSRAIDLKILWFALLKESTIIVYEQYTIFGIIPISKPRQRYYIHTSECEALKKSAEIGIEVGVNALLRFLPFGGYLAPQAALKALDYKRKSN